MLDKKILPMQDYLLVEVYERDSSVVKTEDIRDSKQKGKVLAVGPGTYEFGVFVKPAAQIGDVIYWEEAAEANTPAEIKDKQRALIKSARVIAKEE